MQEDIEKALQENGSDLALKWLNDERIKRNIVQSFGDFHKDFAKIGEPCTPKMIVDYYLDHPEELLSA